MKPYFCASKGCIARNEQGGDHYHGVGWNDEVDRYYAEQTPSPSQK